VRCSYIRFFHRIEKHNLLVWKYKTWILGSLRKKFLPISLAGSIIGFDDEEESRTFRLSLLLVGLKMHDAFPVVPCQAICMKARTCNQVTPMNAVGNKALWELQYLENQSKAIIRALHTRCSRIYLKHDENSERYTCSPPKTEGKSSSNRHLTSYLP